jgi:hypothetical protein
MESFGIKLIHSFQEIKIYFVFKNKIRVQFVFLKCFKSSTQADVSKFLQKLDVKETVQAVMLILF